MITAIILAGGKGKRMHLSMPKQFLALVGKPVIMHTLERIEKIDEINEVIIPCCPEYKEFLRQNIQAYLLKKNYLIIDGGETRQQSVYNALKSATNNLVLIHEAARPFVKIEEFVNIIKNAEDNIIYGYDIPFTVLECKNDLISGIKERDKLVNVQLPQKFNRQELIEAHELAESEKRIFTEDASLLYYYKKLDIHIIKGTLYNIKITEPADLILGEQIYKEYIVGRD